MAAGIDAPKNSRLSREYVDSLPYASIAAWFEGAPKALLVLASIESGDRFVWHSAERQAISTKGPFVVQSIGTELELRGSDIKPPVADLRRATGIKFERTLDVQVEGQRHLLAVSSTFRAGGNATIDLLGQEHRVRHYVESVRSGGKPRYRNDYWIDDSDGFCWKSRQIVVPTMPHLNIEILKRFKPGA